MVERHKVINTKFDSLSSLSVGNGKFAFTVDVTGFNLSRNFMQKVFLWAHRVNGAGIVFPLTPENYTFNETLKNYKLNGRDISYSVQLKEPERGKNAVNWFRQNPHRLQLGNIGLEITKNDGTLAAIEDIKDIHQTLNMWTGEITFSI